MKVCLEKVRLSKNDRAVGVGSVHTIRIRS